MRLFIVLAAAMLLLPDAVQGGTIVIPDDYPTIQQGIDAATDGDVVLVKQGTYFENINLKGKLITVKSAEGPRVTMIDGGRKGPTVRFSTGFNPDSVLMGFTVMNGAGFSSGGVSRGGGIFMEGKMSPTIENNIIRHNEAQEGGGIYAFYASPIIRNNLIMANRADTGGGVYLDTDTNPLIEGNTFYNNQVQGSPGYGGGIYCGDHSVSEILDSRFEENQATYGGAIACMDDSSVHVANGIFWKNSAGYKGGGVYCGGGADTTFVNCTFCNNSGDLGGAFCFSYSTTTIVNSIFWDNPDEEFYILSTGTEPTVEYCDVWGNWPGKGNFFLDPRFVDLAAGDFHMLFTSPCRNSGNDAAPGLPDSDFEGDPRSAYGKADVGADEFHEHLYCTGDFVPGGAICVKVLGLPTTSPVGLWVSPALLDPPLPSAWGDWFLAFPVYGPFILGTVPAPGGLITLPAQLPPQPPGPYTFYLQALVGASLTNPFEVLVK